MRFQPSPRRRSGIAGTFILVLHSSPSIGQLINGQIFTPGLLILNAPAPNATFSAGGTISISFDISGDGLLPNSNTDAAASSQLPTAIMNVDVFLISFEQGVNITVSEGSQLTQGESGSSVKHLDFKVPSCIPPGPYNFTYQELSQINSQPYFSIYSTPLTIQNSDAAAVSQTCNNATTPSLFALQDSRPPNQPFINKSVEAFSISTAAFVQTHINSGGIAPTIAPTPGIQTPIHDVDSIASGTPQIATALIPSIIAQPVVVAFPTAAPSGQVTVQAGGTQMGPFGVPLLAVGAGLELSGRLVRAIWAAGGAVVVGIGVGGLGVRGLAGV